MVVVADLEEQPFLFVPKMGDSTKKISFGFNKSIKKSILNGNPTTSSQNKIELIDCLEGQAIKVKNEVIEIKQPLVIPVGKSKTILDRIKESQLKEKPNQTENNSGKPDSELTLDELAARELLRDAQQLKSLANPTKILQLPSDLDEKFVNEGKPESTLEDYEAVPISEYGMAMLRGMGWKEGMPIGKNPKPITVKEPELRPKGLGLGANKLVAVDNTNSKVNEEELILRKGAFAKINNGKYTGYYCQVQGFDEEAGRIIVKLTLNGLVLSLIEFMVMPVRKQEYINNSKVLNQLKYEEYKNQSEQTTSYKDDKERSSSNKQSPYSRKESDDESHRKHEKHKSRKERDFGGSSKSDKSRKHHRKSKHRDRQ